MRHWRRRQAEDRLATSRTYPHVGGVKDREAQTTIRLLWDRVFDVTDQVTAAQSTIDTQAATIADQASEIAVLQRKVTRLSIQPVAQPTSPGSGEISNVIVDGTFTTGPTAINFPGIGIVQVYSSPDVSGWTQTGTISRFGFSPGVWNVNYSTIGAWLPGVNIGGGTFQEATIWLFLQIAGVWYGAGAERLRPSQTAKPESVTISQWPSDFWYDATRWGPLAGANPSGLAAAALITAGSTRLDNRTLVTERTNLITFTWPPDGTTTEIV